MLAFVAKVLGQPNPLALLTMRADVAMQLMNAHEHLRHLENAEIERQNKSSSSGGAGGKGYRERADGTREYTIGSMGDLYGAMSMMGSRNRGK